MHSANEIRISSHLARLGLLALKIFLLLLVSGYLSTNLLAQERLCDYTVAKGDRYGTPHFTGRAHRSFTCAFRLCRDWEQLYENPDRSTHKLFGVKGVGGRNSMRLGVRRAPDAIDGLVAVVYTHTKGIIGYEALITPENERVLLRFDSLYTCRIEEEGAAWRLSLFDATGKLMVSCVKRLSIPHLLRYKSGIYIEVGNQPSLWTIHTLMREIKGN